MPSRDKIPGVRQYSCSGSSTEVVGDREFRLLSYTGTSVSMPWGDEVVDLGSMRFSEKMPVLMQHDHSRRVGYITQTSVDAGHLTQKANGVSTEHFEEYKRLAADGFPWQVSIGFQIGRAELVEEGESVEVNGREFSGPIIILRDSVLREASLCSVGRDGGTEAYAHTGEHNDCFVEVEMAEDVTHSEDAKRTEIAEYREAFPGRLEYAVAQYEKGIPIIEARAALVPILEEQVRALSAEVDRLGAELSKERASGETGVVYSVPADSDSVVDPKPGDYEPVEKRCEWQWRHNIDNCRAEFPDLGSFTAYTSADEAGTVRILSAG